MNEKDHSVQFMLGLGAGFVAGVIATLLLAPQAGEETRRQFRESARRESDNIINRIVDIMEEEAERIARRIGDELLEFGRAFVEERQARLRAAKENGRPNRPNHG